MTNLSHAASAVVRLGAAITLSLALFSRAWATEPAAVRVAVVNTPQHSGLIDALSADFMQMTGIAVEIYSGNDVYERARAVALALGFELGEGGTGGASDGNFTAALGIPTLDGLGAVGDGAHALDEHVVIEELPLRAALLAGLLSGMHDYTPWSVSDVGAGLRTGPSRGTDLRPKRLRLQRGG